MELTIKGTSKEIADLVVAIQGQQNRTEIISPLSIMKVNLQNVIYEAIRDTGSKAQY
ncbi:MAG: hypothetical protein U0O22_04015 [Acutalibacteraceae bacterium]